MSRASPGADPLVARLVRAARWRGRRLAAICKAPVRRLLTRRRAQRLAASDDPPARAIGNSILAAEGDRVSAAEAGWVRRIEAVRAEMLRSDETLTSTKYEYTGDPEDEDEVTVSRLAEVCRISSKPARWGYFLLRLVRELHPPRALELGTCVGVSAAYQGAGLELAGGGRLMTVEAIASRAERARETLSAVGLGAVEVRRGRFEGSLPGVLADLESLGYAFIDGHHDERATVEYYEAIAPSCLPGCVLVFDDIRWSKGMRRAWERIASDDRVRLAVEIDNVGVCVLGAASQRTRLRIPVDELHWTAPMAL